MANFEFQAKRMEEKVLHYHESLDGWNAMKTHKGVQISYKQSPHFQGTLYKFECDLDECDEAVYNVMRPPINSRDRLDWDKSIKDYMCLKEISEDMIIGCIITHSVMMGLISMREFVDLYYFRPNMASNHKDYDRISWIFAENLEFEGRPVTKKYVRALNYPTGYAVARCRSDPNKSKLILYVNCDIGGMLPRSLVDAALPSQQVSYIESVMARVRAIKGKK